MRRTIIALASTLGLVLALAPRPVSSADRVALAVIVGKTSKISALSSKELRDIFLGNRQTWDDGTKIVPLNLPPEAPERGAFDRAALGMSTEEVSRAWVDRRIRGQGSEPKTVPSVLLLERVVAQTPGAIAYVRQSQVIDLVKAIAIDGRPVGDPAYPLLVSLGQ